VKDVLGLLPIEVGVASERRVQPKLTAWDVRKRVRVQLDQKAVLVDSEVKSKVL